jgi:adenine deaminase
MGGIAGVLRLLVKNGIDPLDAVRFATVNNAQRLAQAGISEAVLIGALAPGMAADIVLLGGPLRQFQIDLVIHEGKVVAEKGELVKAPQPAAVPRKAFDTMPLVPVTAEVFRVAAPIANGNRRVRVRVLELPKPPALPFPNLIELDLPHTGGYIETGGYTIIAVFNRYGKSEPAPVIGLIQGYTLKAGAVASTLAHDSHNLIVLGANAEDMALAANTVINMKGGMAAARNGQVLARIAFPVGGLMADETVETMALQASAFRRAIGELGLDPKSPILPFAIFSLPAGPGDKITDRGIWCAQKRALVELLV